jgi:hypothetical protein
MNSCTHPTDKIVTHTSGSMQTVDGEAWDDMQDILVCTACGQELEEMPDQPTGELPGRMNLVGQRKPQAMIAATLAAEAAWSEYNEAINRWLAKHESISRDDLDKLQVESQECDLTCARMAQEFNASFKRSE